LFIDILQYMKALPILCALIGVSLLSSSLQAQPEMSIGRESVEAQLRFLASDALQGRRTGSPGNDIAAHFIAAHLQGYGYQPAPGLNGYFQDIPFEQGIPPVQASLTIGKTGYKFNEDFVLMAGQAAALAKAEAVFAGYGWVDPATGHDDYKALDVRGKVVFVLSGRPDVSDPRAAFNAMGDKRQFASLRGAAALIEIYRLPFPWNFFSRYVGGESLRVVEGSGDGNAGMIYGWLKEKPGSTEITDLQQGKKLRVALSSSGYISKPVRSSNVVGILPGSDPVLSKEYILLTAHFDHVGVGKQGGGVTTPTDSIFNGARDNAMGTVALLTAAAALAKERPARSVIVAAVTGEEIGLLGSNYFAEHPPVPLKDIIFNLNTDGAGYNDPAYIAVIGWGRTGTNAWIEKSAEAVGLKVFPDPAPEQGLFDRSDNVSFAVKGIPCLTFTPGLTSFDDTINKYYHQVADEADNVDMDYLLRYARAFAISARLIANDPARPKWAPGDKYEGAGKALYGMED
jgi:hypothetical protein